MKELGFEIAGEGATLDVVELARRVAEAQIDLIRVRRARHNLICRELNEPAFARKKYFRDVTNLMKILFGCLRRDGPDAVLPPEVAQYADHVIHWNPQWQEKLFYVLSDLSHELIAMDRYERRARSRRKFAIREFDRARREAMSLDKARS